VLTDNGKEFTDAIAAQANAPPPGEHPFDQDLPQAACRASPHQANIIPRPMAVSSASMDASLQILRVFHLLPAVNSLKPCQNYLHSYNHFVSPKRPRCALPTCRQLHPPFLAGMDTLALLRFEKRAWYLFGRFPLSGMAERAQADWPTMAPAMPFCWRSIVAVRANAMYLHPARLDDVRIITGNYRLERRACGSCNGLDDMGMRPYPGHPGLPQRRGPSARMSSARKAE